MQSMRISRGSCHRAVHAARPVYRGVVRVRAADAAVSTTSLVREIDPETFRDLTQNSEVPVLVDFFTQWCGPCKMIAPQLEAMAAEFKGRIVMTKIDCGAYEKRFAADQNIKALPTFHVWHRGVKIGETTGANVNKLRAFVEQHAL